MSFTIEWFCFIESLENHPRIFSINTFPESKIAVSIENSFFRLWINSGIRFQEPLSGIFNIWTHFAIVKNDQIVTIYKNGQKLGNSFDYFNGMITDWDDVLSIGSDKDAQSYFIGKISGFKWSSIALYNSNFNTSLLSPFTDQNTLLYLDWSATLSSVVDLSQNNRPVTNQGVVFHPDSPGLNWNGSIRFSGHPSDLTLSDLDDFDFLPILLSEVTTTTSTTTSLTTTTTSTTTQSEGISTTTTSTTSLIQTTTTTTSTTTTFIPRELTYKEKMKELYKRINKISLNEDDHFYLWKQLVDEKVRYNELELLKDVVLIYYRFEYRSTYTLEFFTKEAWKKIKFYTPSVEGVKFKSLFDQKGVYPVGENYYETSSNQLLGKIEEFSIDQITGVRSTKGNSYIELVSATSSVFEKWSSAIDYLKL